MRNKCAGSLVGELLFLLFTGLLSSLLFFCITHISVSSGLDHYFSRSAYLSDREAQTVQSLQNHITQNRLTPYDYQALSKWVKKQNMVYLEIYRDNQLLYASENWDHTILYEADTGAYEDKYYTLSFTDGDADLFLFGAFEYQFYTRALVAELLCSFLVFLFIFVRGINRRIQYIRDLSAGIRIMEGGCLDEMISVKGVDELAELAGGLEALRRSLKKNIENENALRLANQKLTTGMAHDLRTPLTALTMYVQILQSGVCKDEEKNRYYLDKIMSKAALIKDLSDRLFESSRTTDGEQEKDLWEVCTVQEAFMDPLSEMAMLLKNRGFHVEADFKWSSAAIRVRMDYIARIIDNIGSNLQKYADPDQIIRIRSISEDAMAGIEIINQKRRQETPVESAGVGLENVRHLVDCMGGNFQTEMDQTSFKIQVLFPVAGKGLPH